MCSGKTGDPASYDNNFHVILIITEQILFAISLAVFS